MSASLNIREMQIQATANITSHWSEWPWPNTLQTNNAREGVERRGPSCSIVHNHIVRPAGRIVWMFTWKITQEYFQFSSVAQSCPTLCNPMNRSTPGLPVHHQLPEFTQTRVHRVSDAIQPSHPLSSPSPPASNPSQHQSIFQWVNSSHEVAKVLEFQL